MSRSRQRKPPRASASPAPPRYNVDALVQRWRQKQGIGKDMTAVRTIPARDAITAPIPKNLAPELRELLQTRGFSHLYSHQAEAVAAALNGEDVVVVTPTASGKSLCYNLPVLDALSWGGNAIYMFPTKALSQDQCAELNAMLAAHPHRKPDWEAQVYDGDTPSNVRERIRRNGRLILTNPDMLHAAILPHHARWATLLSRLEYIVIDELHTYRGVFGSHVANVLRRLLRICAHHGASPTFLCTSATIANPCELARALTSRPTFTLIDRSGAPHPPRTICFLNPPIADEAQQRRQSALAAATRVATQTLDAGLGTIVFARSRQSVEILVHRLKQDFMADSSALADRVTGYRGGYLPELRRQIERGLRDGSLLGVVSTNALELGIDIGQLDVCVLAGYPGTIASTWQQIGRAGRRGAHALAILIATDSPLDQFMIQHPDYFFAQPPEHARVDPANLRVVAEHIKCACYELPIRRDERFGDFEGDAVEEVLEFLEAQTGLVKLSGGCWRWSKSDYPASQVNLRNIREEGFVVVDITTKRERVVAEVDFESAHISIYPEAIYLLGGEPYRVARLDYEGRRAYVVRSREGHYTAALSYRAVHVLECFEEGMRGQVSVGFGEVCMTERVTGFKKVRFGTGEMVGYGALAMPELELHTMSYWLTLSSATHHRSGEEASRWARVIYGVGQVMQVAASLLLMCDPRDIDLCIGSVSEDAWLTRGVDGVQVRRAARDEDEDESGDTRSRGALHNPSIFIYDRFAGGVGFGEGLYERHEELMALSRELVEGCACEEGCPSCVGPPGPGEEPCKEGARSLLLRCVGSARSPRHPS